MKKKPIKDIRKYGMGIKWEKLIPIVNITIALRVDNRAVNLNFQHIWAKYVISGKKNVMIEDE